MSEGKSKWEAVIGSASIVVSACGILFKVSCGDWYMKLLLAGILILGCWLLIKAIFKSLWIGQRSTSIILATMVLLGGLLLGRWLFIYQCNESAHTGNTYIDQSTVDKSIHFNKPEVRHLNEADIEQIVKAFPNKQITLEIRYLKARVEDKVLFNEIVEKLRSLGYEDIRESEATHLSANLQKGRLSIIDDEIEKVVIVNPN